MGDDWEDEPANEAPKGTSSFAGGTNTGRGRGYSAQAQSTDDTWESNPQSYNNDSYDNENRGNGDYRGRGRGRGGRGRGGGGGRDRDGDNGGRRNYENGGEENGFEKRRERKNDDDGIDDNNIGEDGEERKPPVTYIPPERSEDDIYTPGNTAGINFDNYESIEVKISGENPLPPVQNFGELKLRNHLMENINKSGYIKATPVQKHAIPNILNGRDLMACAQTGSGKTAAFLIPIIHKLLAEPSDRVLTERGCQPQVVIMSPTRELTDQIYGEALKFSKDTVIKCAAVYGGVKTTHQGDRLRGGIDIVVATPGRLNDFVNHGRINFSSIRFIVLDEADRMLDQGFLPAMEQILNHTSMVPPGQRQTLMFSATFSADVQALCAQYLKDYLFLTVGIVGAANKDVDQKIYEVEKKHKKSKLKEIIEEHKEQLGPDCKEPVKILVFVETKKNADYIAAYLCECDFPTTSIHGDRLQQEREKALSDFRSGRMPILVATSVAARGLDIKNVTHVINYDMPKAAEEYVHRIGRTGRVGNKGKASSFFDPSADGAMRDDLVQVLANAGQEIPDFLGGGGGGGYGDAGASNAFGGYDIRNNAGGGGGGGGAAEPEEEW